MNPRYKLSTLLILLLIPLSLVLHKVILTVLDRQFFIVKKVDISGAVNSLDSELKLLLSTMENQSLSKVDLQSLKQNILGSPLIENVIITKEFPNTLKIVIEERKPVALLKLENSVHVVDKKGVILPLVMNNLIPISIEFGVAINGNQVVDESVLEMLASIANQQFSVAHIIIDRNRKASFELHDSKVKFLINKHPLTKDYIQKAQNIAIALKTDTNSKMPKFIDLYSDQEFAIGYFK